MDVFYKHDVDIFFNGFGSLFTTFECCLCQDYSNTNDFARWKILHTRREIVGIHKNTNIEIYVLELTAI